MFSMAFLQMETGTRFPSTYDFALFYDFFIRIEIEKEEKVHTENTQAIAFFALTLYLSEHHVVPPNYKGG